MGEDKSLANRSSYGRFWLAVGENKKIDIEQYKNKKGIELIAQELKIDYPAR